jgi:hypothetical protein
MRAHELTDLDSRLRAVAAKLGRTTKDVDLNWHLQMLRGSLEAFRQDAGESRIKNDKKHPLTYLLSMAKGSNANNIESRLKLNFLRCL